MIVTWQCCVVEKQKPLAFSKNKQKNNETKMLEREKFNLFILLSLCVELTREKKDEI